MASSRTRNYASIVYVESAPTAWLDLLKECHVNAFVSPCHDKDLDKDGNVKKAHWHVMIMFDSVKTENQAKEIFNSFGGVGCEKINAVKGYARYLCHLDDDDKVQYNPDDVLAFGTADYQKMIFVEREKDVVMGEIVDYILENEHISFAYLVKYSRYNKPEWFKCLVSSGSAYLVKELLYSIRDCSTFPEKPSFDYSGSQFVADKENVFEKKGCDNND